jgi:plastocyanin
MINGLNVIGLGCIFTFVLFLMKVLKTGPYISNFGKGDTSRIKKIYIIPANKVTPSGKAIMSQFKPRILTIRKGDTVEFINDDKIRHAIEIGNTKIHNSDVLIPGGVHSVTIEEDGYIAYRSSLYPHIGSGFINIVSIGKSASPLKGHLGRVFGDNKSIKIKNRIHTERSIPTEGKIRTEGEIRTEGKIRTESEIRTEREIPTEGNIEGKSILENKFKDINIYSKSIKNRFKRIVKSAVSLVYGIGPAIDSILDVFDICSEKGLMECLKNPKTKKIGLYIGIILFLVIGGLYIYKNLLSGNLLLPIQMDGGNIRVAI